MVRVDDPNESERLVTEMRQLQQKRHEQEEQQRAIVAKRRLLYPGGIPPQPLLKEYAEHLGHVILMAAEADAVLSALGGQLIADGKGIDLSGWGESGQALVSALRKVATDRPEVLNLAGRYEMLYARRNQLVHSIRPNTDGPDAYVESVRPRRRQKGVGASSAMPVNTDRITVPDLVQAYFDWQDLRNDAIHVSSDLRRGQT